MFGYVATELPKDEELNNYIDVKIPGLSPTTECSFDFVEVQVVCTQLIHLSCMKQDAIVSLLETYKPTQLELSSRHAPYHAWHPTVTGIWILQRKKAPSPWPGAHTPLSRSTCLN